VRGRIREIMLPAAEDMPRKDSQWMYMTVIRSALGGESEGTNITPQVIQKYEQKFGKGSWEVTIDAYPEHISNIDSFEGVHWSGPLIYCTPPEQERLMNPLSPIVFHGNTNGALLFHQHVLYHYPRLITAWAQIVWFIGEYADTIGEEWDMAGLSVSSGDMDYDSLVLEL